jgi:hypothetical protein
MPNRDNFNRLFSSVFFVRFLLFAWISALAIPAINCGGGGSSSSSSNSSNPPTQSAPSLSSLSPSSTTAGSPGFTITITGSTFASGCSVYWGSSARSSNYISSTKLSFAVTTADVATAGTVFVSVSCGGKSSNAISFIINILQPLSVATKRLPDAIRTKLYGYDLQASGGISPYTWSIASGSLPTGLSLLSGKIVGTPPTVSSDTTFNFSVRVTDSAAQPASVSQSLSILVRSGGLGRNDTCASATPIINGVTRASISPFGDIDVYSFHGTLNAHVNIYTVAQGLTIYANSTSTDIFLDTFVELLDSNCTPLIYNDDSTSGSNLDSYINDYVLPYTGTYFIRVSDARGDGRPDFIYDIHLSGADN